MAPEIFEFQEGEQHFRFEGVLDAWRLPESDDPKPEGMSFVDFVIEETDRLLLVEVKNPNAVRSTVQPEVYLRDLKNKVHGKIVPKARDSWCYLYLMGKIRKPCVFILYIGTGTAPFDSALVSALESDLQRKIRQEGPLPWVNQYAEEALILTDKTWSSSFPNYAIRTE